MLLDMSQHTDGSPQHTADMSQATYDMSTEKQRFTVDEAARILGISTGAVRNRLSRGTLESVKDDGSVYVLLPVDMLRDTDDISQDTDDISSDIPHDSDALLLAKDETIRILQEQLDQERSASAELRRIIAGLVQRVPELQPAQKAPEAHQTPGEGPDGLGDPAPNAEEPESRQLWWRRMLGA